MSSINPQWEISVDDVKRLMDNDGDSFVLIDCREPEEHALGTIPGAKLFPLSNFKSFLPQLEQYADKQVVIHCHKGGRSLQATEFLRQQEFANVKSMAGGIDEWSQRIDPSIPRY